MAAADTLTELQAQEQEYDSTVRADIELFRKRPGISSPDA